MPKTYINALVQDKNDIGIDPLVRDSLRTYYQRNLYMDNVKDNPTSSIIDNNEDICLHRAANEGFDVLILTWEGNLFDIHRYHHACVRYAEELDEKTKGNWLIAGQLIDQYANRKFYGGADAEQWKDSFWLFPITAIINLKMWDKLGRPSWGQPTDGNQSVLKVLPSEECVHDGYTPFEFRPGTTQVNVKVKKGWNIVNSSLLAGVTVYNLNNEIRGSQDYLYPEVNVDRFNKFWHAIYDMPKLTDQYRRVLEKVILCKHPRRINDITWQCFIRNTEDYFPRDYQEQFDFSTVDTVLLPSSGFKDFIFTMGKKASRKPVEVIHFDIIKQCVEIRKKIISRWDGSRAEFKPVLEGISLEYKHGGTDSVYHMHAMKDLEEAYDAVLEHFENEEDLKNCWQQFKNFNHKYIEADMLDEPYATLNMIQGKHIYICLSDIAGWRNNIIGYGYQNLRNDIIKCLVSIRKRGLTGIVDYKDPATDLQMWQEFDKAIDYLKTPPVIPVNSGNTDSNSV